MSEQGRRPSLHLVAAEAAQPDCASCTHRDSVLAAGRCVPGDICLIAHSGRQIDRFLRVAADGFVIDDLNLREGRLHLPHHREHRW